MTNSLSGDVVCGASLSRGRAYNTPKLLSILQRDGKRKSGKSDARERDQRGKSMAGNEGKLTAFITAFSPCHGLSLRHSLHAIERQAICLSPSHPLAALYKHALIRLRIYQLSRASEWICATLSPNYREVMRIIQMLPLRLCDDVET